MTTRVSGRSITSRRVASIPDMPGGMRISMITTSGWIDLARSNAASPLSTSVTSYPSPRSAAATAERTIGSSSTTSTRDGSTPSAVNVSLPTALRRDPKLSEQFDVSVQRLDDKLERPPSGNRPADQDTVHGIATQRAGPTRDVPQARQPSLKVELAKAL